ncbi:MAG: AI-2E family transporter [Synergistaceae bacterium]|jgi:predicted PurR-regulated permease PerM|nr:AI-2E family transporter [Synergistaceae bacterium]
MNGSYGSKNTKGMRNSSIPFVLLLCTFLILSLVVVRPLASALAWAAILSFFTYPAYNFIFKKILRGKYSYLASGINTMLILFLLILPVTLIGFAVASEAGRLYSLLVNWYPGNEFSLNQILSIPQLSKFLDMYPDFFSLPIWRDLFSNASRVTASFLARMSRDMLGNAFKITVSLVVITFASFFITRDGHLLLKFMRDIMPLTETSKDTFFIKCKQMLYGIFYGVILTAGIQGTLGAIGWRFVGLPNAVIFGVMMFFLAMIPFVGTPLVWGFGVLYLFLKGESGNGIILLVWGVTMVSGIDNLLRPLFISEGSKASVLMVFIGIIGGLSTWGFLGLFLGPLVLSASFFLLRIYRLVVAPTILEPVSPSDGGKEETSPE